LNLQIPKNLKSLKSLLFPNHYLHLKNLEILK
jgi:hypothetical protein